VTVRKIIKAPKQITKAGEWKCGALNPKHKMGPQSFNFGGPNPFQLGNQWWWRVDHLSWLGGVGRVLTAYHLANENYLAWLAMERGKDHVIVGCLEFHGTHPGWHFHSRCDDVNEFRAGAQRQRNGGIRIPAKGRYHRQMIYGMGPQEALNRAYAAFNVGTVEKEGSLL
jgi:hypothetical protein